MSIALGLPCRDALLICADEEVSVRGPYKSSDNPPDKYYEERISCLDLFGSAVVSSYGGSPELWEEANEKITRRLLELQGPQEEGDVCVIPQAVYDPGDEVLTAMGPPSYLPRRIRV